MFRIIQNLKFNIQNSRYTKLRASATAWGLPLLQSILKKSSASFFPHWLASGKIAAVRWCNLSRQILQTPRITSPFFSPEAVTLYDSWSPQIGHLRTNCTSPCPPLEGGRGEDCNTPCFI